MARHKDSVWGIPDNNNSYESASLAVLMDLRDELKALNRIMSCHNTLAIPQLLRDIKKNTTKPRKKVSKKRK